MTGWVVEFWHWSETEAGAIDFVGCLDGEGIDGQVGRGEHATEDGLVSMAAIFENEGGRRKPAGTRSREWPRFEGTDRSKKNPKTRKKKSRNLKKNRFFFTADRAKTRLTLLYKHENAFTRYRANSIFFQGGLQFV